MNPTFRLERKNRAVLNAVLIQGAQGGDSAIERLNPAEAFAVIPLAAVCADRRLQLEEADVVMTHLRGRSPYREMDPVDFGTMVSSLLMDLRDRRQALLKEAASLMSPEQQERAFALAAHLVHADRVASEEEADFMAELSYTLSIPKARLEEIEATISLLSQDITS